MYRKSRTFIKKQDNLRLLFIQKEPYTLGYTIFDESFVISIYIYIKNHDTLRYVKFLYTKSWHIQKSKTICVTFFNIQKAWQFELCNFHGIFEISGGGGHFYF